MRKITALLLISTLFAACSSGTLSESGAKDIIEKCLENNSKYDDTRFEYGTMKFRGNSGRELLDKYHKLEDAGLIEMDEVESKKAFLSKDSTYTYDVKLTDKAKALVISQKENNKGEYRAVVKTRIYQLDELRGIDLNASGKTARVSVVLKKEDTGFAVLLPAQPEKEAFLVTTLHLKLRKEKWSYCD